MADVELTEVEKHKIKIMRNVYRKLDGLPLSFGLPQYDDEIPDEDIIKYFSIDLSDTLRETGINMEQLAEGSSDELAIENRTVYHALKRFRLTASTFFKFSTAVDGKSIDKTQVPKMLKQIIDEYDKEYKEWKCSSTGSLWNRSSSLNYTSV